MQKDFKISTDFQTPPIVADYMAGLLPKVAIYGTVLEPTPGLGNLVYAAEKKGYRVIAPERFEDINEDSLFSAAIMNPPFTPMAEGFRYLEKVMNMTDNIVCLLPWMLLTNSQKRLQKIMDYGLFSVTNLPRKTFPNSRVQCCVIKMQRGYRAYTYFENFNF